jgi:hypothetical protein
MQWHIWYKKEIIRVKTTQDGRFLLKRLLDTQETKTPIIKRITELNPWEPTVTESIKIPAIIPAKAEARGE